MSEGQQEKRISIIVPVYNIEKYIEKTINCVRAQTYENWELLLVLDGCTDNTRAVIEENLKEKPDDQDPCDPPGKPGCGSSQKSWP